MVVFIDYSLEQKNKPNVVIKKLNFGEVIKMTCGGMEMP